MKAAIILHSENSVAERSGQTCRIAFISSNSLGWGGSEELWSSAAAELAASGHRIVAMKPGLGKAELRVERLRRLGARVIDLRQIPLVPDRTLRVLVRASWLVEIVVRALRFGFALRAFRPDLVVLSQGGNVEGLFFAKRILRLGTPYVLIVQKVAEMYWPTDHELADLRSVYAGARRCLFVSEHNLRLHEEQLGMKLANAEVVRNPFLVPWDRPAPWPDEDEGLRLACVGRLYPREKGQDILLKVLARQRWRKRPVELSFFGGGRASRGSRGDRGPSRAHQCYLCRLFDRCRSDLARPSRARATVALRRPAARTGRSHAEWPRRHSHGRCRPCRDGEDGVTGFLAAAPTTNHVDEALERAWQRRSEWPAIGEAAALRARELVPPRPAGTLAEMIAAWAGEGDIFRNLQQTARASHLTRPQAGTERQVPNRFRSPAPASVGRPGKTALGLSSSKWRWASRGWPAERTDNFTYVQPTPT